MNANNRYQQESMKLIAPHGDILKEPIVVHSVGAYKIDAPPI